VGLFLLVLTSLAVLETVGLLTHAGYPALKWTTLGVSLLWMLGAWIAVVDPEKGTRLKWMVPAVSAWAVFLGCLFRSDQTRSLDKLAGSFFTVAYIPGLMQFILLLLYSAGGTEGDGRSLLLYGILVIKSTDMGAYFTGRACGRHKLIPRISPAKTWEGVLGGVAAAVAVSCLMAWSYGFTISGHPLSLVDAVALGILLAVSGILGDLVESMLKRAADIKDSGSWLKGMGGILDVMDSLIFALPVLYLYLSLQGNL
jgi:phosphatidate cytidylyltransferase